MGRDDEPKDVVLVLAPRGQDGKLAAAALEQEQIRTHICRNLVDLGQRFGEQTNALLIAEESLVPHELPLLLEQLHGQPPWSDVPVIILTAPGGGDRASVQALEVFGPAANVSLLERPLRAVTLVAAVKVALRARRRQRQLRDLIAERETVLASISDAFSALDRNWRYVYVNDKVAELAGLPKEKIVGRVIWHIFPGAIGGEFYERCYKAMASRQPDHFETFYKPWQRWLDTRIYPTKNGLAIFRADITARKEHEKRLRESQQQLQELQERVRLAVEAADVGTFDYDPATKELKWSERCHELFGLARGTRPSYEAYVAAIHPEDRHIIYATADKVADLRSGGRYQIEYRIIGAKNSSPRWVAEKGRAILDAEGRPARYIGTILDITESKNAALALQRAKQEAEEANLAKDRFLAMLSHELRTPLTPVLMTINSLQRDPNVSREVLHDLELVQRNVELEALLIDDLLDLTRITHGKLQLHHDVADVHAALDHALTIASSDLKAKNLKLTCQFQAREHFVWADAARLQQVFWNLLKNAIKFTPAAGSIEIRTRNDRSHHIVIEVADTGVGVAPELQPKIFDAFEQGGRAVTSKYGGLGLGLAISKRVIDLHEGTIAVSSEGEGNGATFIVTLKTMETQLPEGAAPYLPFEARQAARAKVLLVEDHEDTAQVLCRVLERAGHDVELARTVKAAEEIAPTHAFDLVISDVGLPDGSGLDLMRWLRNRYGLTGIALSGYGMDQDRNASFDAGFAEHFTKPVDAERLRNAIERLVTKDPGVPAGET